MKKQLFVIFLFSISFYSQAQITFQKTFGGTGNDFGLSVQQTTDGGYIFTGYVESFGAGANDVYLMKTDANGDSLWTKTFGGTYNDAGFSVQQTTDGGYIITGITSSFGMGGADVYLIKTDTNGDSLWTKTYGGTNNEEGWSIVQTTDGGYIVTGYTNSFGIGNNNVYLIKTDANGDSLWTKTFGGIGYDYGFSVRQTTDGGYIISGSTGSFGMGGADVYLIKTNSIGNPLWTKTFGGTNQEYGNSVQQTTNGGYIITGYTGLGNPDVYLIKTNANGDSLWTKTFGGTASDGAYFVKQTLDGGYIVTGYTNSFGMGNVDVYLIKTDSNGDSLWIKTFGGINNEAGYSIEQTTDGGYIITGYTESLAGDWDIYLIKTDANGNSGCNEGSTATIVSTTAIQITSPATIVSSGSTITSPATIVGSGGIVNTLCTTVGINEITKDNPFLISPNPSSGNFAIAFSHIINNGTIALHNVLGEMIFSEKIKKELKKEINLQNISQGIYFVKVFDGEKYYCKKIIIEQD